MSDNSTISQSSSWCLIIACFVRPTIQKPKDIHFAPIEGHESQQIFTLERLEAVRFWHFSFKNYLKAAD